MTQHMRSCQTTPATQDMEMLSTTTKSENIQCQEGPHRPQEKMNSCNYFENSVSITGNLNVIAPVQEF